MNKIKINISKLKDEINIRFFAKAGLKIQIILGMDELISAYERDDSNIFLL